MAMDSVSSGIATSSQYSTGGPLIDYFGAYFDAIARTSTRAKEEQPGGDQAVQSLSSPVPERSDPAASFFNPLHGSGVATLELIGISQLLTALHLNEAGVRLVNAG
jgi:hypothetical protein